MTFRGIHPIGTDLTNVGIHIGPWISGFDLDTDQVRRTWIRYLSAEGHPRSSASW